MARAWLGLDLGGTNCRLGLVDEDGALREQSRFATQAQRGPGELVARMAAALGEMAGRARDLGLEPAGAGVACPGVIDRRAGVVRFAPNLPGWRDIPLRARLQEATGLALVLENDANLYALGEYRFGKRRGRDLACFTLGTGVGGGLVLAGRLVTGPLGSGGELGHLVVEPGGRRCPCGARGCVEAYAGARALVEQAGELGLARGGVEQLSAGAREGDAACREILARAGRALGRAFALVAAAVGLDLMLIGGGVASAWDLMEPAARAELDRCLHMVDSSRVELAVSSLGDDAPLLGAAAFARQTLAAREDANR